MGLRTWLGLKKRNPKGVRRHKVHAAADPRAVYSVPAVVPNVIPGRMTADFCRSCLGEARTIIEIGANNGKDTVELANAFPEANVYAFEPDPRAARRFRKKVRCPNVTFIEAAVGAADGHADFHMSGGTPPDRTPDPEGWDKSSSLRPPKDHRPIYGWCTFDTTIQVPVHRLDTWARNLNEIDFIWADVQGAECDLIAGGIETLKRTRYFYTEYYNRPLYEGQWNLWQILAALPFFEIVALYRVDVMLRNKLLYRPAK